MASFSKAASLNFLAVMCFLAVQHSVSNPMMIDLTASMMLRQKESSASTSDLLRVESINEVDLDDDEDDDDRDVGFSPNYNETNYNTVTSFVNL